MSLSPATQATTDSIFGGPVDYSKFYTDDPTYAHLPVNQRPSNADVQAARDFQFSDAGRRQGVIDDMNWMTRDQARNAEWNRIGTQEMFDQNIGLQEQGLGLKERLYGPYMGAAGDFLRNLDFTAIMEAIPDFSIGFPGIGTPSATSIAAGTGAPPSGQAPGSGLSDVRLKKDIQKVGELTSGLNIYTWEWNDKAHEIGVADSPTYGVVAQEAAKLYPDAVTEGDDGYLRVDYSAGGLGELWN